MKFIFFTDSHFHLFTDFSKPDEFYRNDRFKEQMEALNSVFEIAREKEATIIFGGDLFHKRNAVDTVVYNEVFKVFARNKDVAVLLLRGNHDATTNSVYTDSSIDTFEYLPNVSVFQSFGTIEKDNVNIVFTAYGDETEEIKEYIKENNKLGKVNILVGHLGVEGSLTGKGSHRLEGAFGYQDLLPDKYDFILLGHYHRRQYFQNPNHFYGGSLMQQSFSDEQEANGVHLIDTDTITTEFIPLDTRRFITVRGDDVPEDLDQLIEYGHFIRFVGSTNQAKAIELASTDETNNIRVELQKDYTVEKRIDSEVTDSPLSIASSYSDKYYPEAKKEILECLQEVL
ncbi:recombination exonuclease A [Staphylococcus phage vB_SsapH-Golestan-100]|nr:recombination exonuclease A [Staphylococcus phage vB_SsapH-Golestan-100]